MSVSNSMLVYNTFGIKQEVLDHNKVKSGFHKLLHRELMYSLSYCILHVHVPTCLTSNELYFSSILLSKYHINFLNI